MRKRKVSILLFTALVYSIVYASVLSRMQKALDKGDYEKVEKLAIKSLEKDTINPGARYYLSRIYLESAFSRYNIDSSLIFINGALSDYHIASQKTLESLAKEQIDTATLLTQKALVATAAFGRALDGMTVSVFTDFLEKHQGAKQFHRATFIRDSLAFDIAQSNHTWQGYQSYFQTYPESVFADEAKSRYQKLIFQDYTKDDRLNSYVRFLKEHPNTPFRRLAEEVILERSTINNDWEAYVEFLNDYPRTHLRKKVGDILYYMVKSNGFEHINDVLLIHPKADSLKRMYALEQELLFPIMDNSKFGFSNPAGKVVVPAGFTSIAVDQLCGNITSEWLGVLESTRSVIINRAGMRFLEGELVEEVGASVKLLEKNGSKHLYHSSGYSITAKSVEEVSLLANGWVLYNHENEWGVLTPAGYEVLKPKYTFIEAVGPFMVVEQEGKYAISSFSELSKERHEPLRFEFEDYELIQDSLMQVFTEGKEGLLDASLQYTIPLDDHEVFVTKKFWYFKDAVGYHVINRDENDTWDESFLNMNANEGWLSFKKPDGWLLVARLEKGLMPIHQIDSLKLLNADVAYLQKGDTVQLVFQNAFRKDISRSDKIKVLSNLSSTGKRTAYIVLTDSRKASIMSVEGKVLFSGKYDDVALVKDSLFQVRMNGKVGLKRVNGETALNPRYDVLDDQGDLIYILKEGKIGCVDLTNRVILPAEYEARMQRIGKAYYAVTRDGKLGLVNEANKWVLSADYDQVLEWNDSSCWVRAGALWTLMDLNEKEPILEEVQSVRPWLEMPDQSLAIVLGENGFGLLSSQKGEVLPMQYNDILNLGSLSEPVFFAEQHLKTADFFVVTYFDSTGKSIRSQAFRPEEYDMIYCDE